MINKSVWVALLLVMLVGSSGCVVRNTIKGSGGLFTDYGENPPGKSIYFNR